MTGETLQFGSGDAFLAALLEAVPDFVALVDADFKIRFVNRVQDWDDPADVVGTDVFNFIAPANHAAARECFEAVQRTKQPGLYKGVGTGPNGERAYYETRVTAVPGADGVGLCLVATDVTARQLQEERSRSNDARLELAIEATGMGLWVAEVETGRVVWNRQMHEIHGIDEALAFPQYLEQLVYPADREQAQRSADEWYSTGIFENTYRIVRSDGSIRWLLSSGRIERDALGEPIRIVGGTIDITHQRAVEDRARAAQKREAIGTLTAGVAHNFNNMLMVLLPSLELVAPFVPDSHGQIFEDAFEVGERAAEMVRQLMTFAGQRPSPVRRRTPVLDIVGRAFNLCRDSFGSSVSMSLEIQDADTYVSANSSELTQALVNVLINARDAFEGGTVELPTVSVTVRLDGTESVVIGVRDNGPGMPDAVASRVFEPFFTTNRPSKPGLGLATSLAIVREHGGELTCETSEGEGAYFEIRLPVASALRAALGSEDAEG